MKKNKYVIEIKLDNYLKEKDKLYKVEIYLCDLENSKKEIFNENIELNSEKIKCEILLNENKDYKILLKIISSGKIEKIEQIIFNTSKEYILGNINIVKSENYEAKYSEDNKYKYHPIDTNGVININKKKLISQNPVNNWREENGRTSIYNNGRIIFLKGLLENIWKKCYKMKTIEELQENIKGYTLEYIEKAVEILVEKGVLIEYER